MSMKMAALAGSLAALALAGCGAATPPLSMSCRVQPSGRLIAARVTVQNHTSKPHRSILYGPALAWLAHMRPVLPFHQVVVAEATGRRGFTGLSLPPVGPKDPVSVTLRFARPPKAAALTLTQNGRIHAKSWSAADYPHCYIGGHS